MALFESWTLYTRHDDAFLYLVVVLITLLVRAVMRRKGKERPKVGEGEKRSTPSRIETSKAPASGEAKEEYRGECGMRKRGNGKCELSVFAPTRSNATKSSKRWAEITA